MGALAAVHFALAPAFAVAAFAADGASVSAIAAAFAVDAFAVADAVGSAIAAAVAAVVATIARCSCQGYCPLLVTPLLLLLLIDTFTA